MQQILFRIPEGIPLVGGLPLYGFAACLFLTFVATALVWGPRRAVKIGLPKERLVDLAIVIFLTGIAGARLVYMIQYYDHFRDQTLLGLIASYFMIWTGGIVFYGSVFGATIGFFVFRKLVLQKLGVSSWKLADAVAPLIALGMAIGRIGCYLNGCCWGQPVCEECQPVPLSARLGEFPLMTSLARNQVCRPARLDSRLPRIHGLQTSTGFSIPPRERAFTGNDDPRSLVLALEPGSQAQQAGLLAGDRITRVNGRANSIVVETAGPRDGVDEVLKDLAAKSGKSGLPIQENDYWVARTYFDDLNSYQSVRLNGLELQAKHVYVSAHDYLWEIAREGNRDVTRLDLVVDRGGKELEISFSPRTVPFFPTQLYESVSMLLLVFLLVSFQPFRRHDGQVMVVLMLGYAVHRYFNEAIRIEPTYAFDLTLSQWISVGIFAAGLAMELYLRATQPKLPPGEVSLGHGVAAPAAK